MDISSENEATVTREVDGGLCTVGVKLPAVVTCDLRLNEPRYATLPNIMKARKKNIEAIALSESDSRIVSTLKTLSVSEPAARAPGSKVSSVEQLVQRMSTSGVV